MTLPIVLPIVKQAGFDPVWFGIFLVLVVEMAQISPPVGFNLFVIQGLTGDGLGYIAEGALPYLLIMVLFTLLITVFPADRAVPAHPAGGAIGRAHLRQCADCPPRARRHIVAPDAT